MACQCNGHATASAEVTTVRLFTRYNGGRFGGRTPRVIIMGKNPQDGSESRLERGRRPLSEIDAHAGEQVVASPADIALFSARRRWP